MEKKKKKAAGRDVRGRGELQLFVFVIRAAYFSAAKRDCTNRPYLPTCKAKAND